MMLHRYRATGADLPFADLRLSHPGVAMEGYYWKVTDPSAGRVLIAGIGVNQGPDGPWATLFLGASNGFVRELALPGAQAGADGVWARSGDAFYGDGRRLIVDLGPDARLDLTFSGVEGWPRRALGGSSIFQCVPGLNQYWHPWILGGVVNGVATIGDETWDLRGAQLYAEKNWGREGFPEAWWWGQGQGFAGGASVAFAGGKVTAGKLHTTVTALVVRLPDGRVIRLGNPGTSPVRANVRPGRWELRGRSVRWAITVDAQAPTEDALILPVPLPSHNINVPGDLENLTGSMRVSVRHRAGLGRWKTVWSGSTDLAALEIGGLERAAQEASRRRKQ